MRLPSILAAIGAAILALASVLLVATSTRTGSEADSLYNALGTAVFGLAAVAAAYAVWLYRQHV